MSDAATGAVEGATATVVIALSALEASEGGWESVADNSVAYAAHTYIY